MDKKNVSKSISLYICISVLLRTLNITINEIFVLNETCSLILKISILLSYCLIDLYIFKILDLKSKKYFVIGEFIFFGLMLSTMLRYDSIGINIFLSYGWILVSFLPIIISLYNLEDIDILFNYLYKFSYVFVFLCTLIYIFHVRKISTNLVFSYTLLFPLLIQIVQFKQNKNYKIFLFIIFEFFMLLSYGSRGTLLCAIAFILLLLLKNMSFKQIKYLGLFILGLIIFYEIILYLGVIDKIYLHFMEKGKYIRILDLLSSRNFFDNNGRFDIYKDYLQYIFDKPILGWGIGANLAIGYFPHNFIIEVIFNFGLFSLIIFYFLFELAKKYFRFYSREDTYELFLILLCSGFFPLFFSSTYLEWMNFWIFLGFLICVYHKNIISSKN